MASEIKPVHEWIIIIIDDNFDMADSLRLFLVLNGVTAYLAETGQEGLGLLGEVQPTMVLLDSVMPDMSGEEVLQSIRQRFPAANFPVIAFTATSEINETKARDAGYDGYIEKPFVVGSLIDDLRQILKRSQ